MTLEIEYETEKELLLPYEAIIRRVVEEALKTENCGYDVQIHVVLTDNTEIQKYNRQYRNINRSTDVLSFPMIEYQKPSEFSVVEENPEDYFDPDTNELVLGDIIISVEKVIEQAENFGHSRERELAFLTAHSMLHLFGYDHIEDAERIEMEERQEKILQNLEISR